MGEQMIKPKFKLITVKQFSINEGITYKTALSWMVKANVIPYMIGESKRQNSNGKWSCFLIALDPDMCKAMKEMRAK